MASARDPGRANPAKRGKIMDAERIIELIQAIKGLGFEFKAFGASESDGTIEITLKNPGEPAARSEL
jgi:hypothetical protein